LKPKGIIHYAKLEKSPRLQRLLAFLQTGGEHSTRDIILNTGVVAVSSAAAELRAQGFDVGCKYQGETEDGSRVFVYWLEDRAGVAA